MLNKDSYRKYFPQQKFSLFGDKLKFATIIQIYYDLLIQKNFFSVSVFSFSKFSLYD